MKWDTCLILEQRFRLVAEGKGVVEILTIHRDPFETVEDDTKGIPRNPDAVAHLPFEN